MYAVIVTGGKQYRVRKGETVRVERLAVEEGAKIEFDRVLMVGEGEEVKVGTPFVKGSKVSGKVKAHGRDRKIKVIKFKRRKNYLRTQGHRQSYTDVEITSIAGAGTAKAPEAAAAKQAAPVAKTKTDEPRADEPRADKPEAVKPETAKPKADKPKTTKQES